MSNARDLLELINSIKSLSHKYNEDTEYLHLAYHTLLRCFMLFWRGDYSNWEYKQQFKEKIEVLEAYNGGGSYLGTAREPQQEISPHWDWTRRSRGTWKKRKHRRGGNTWRPLSYSAWTGVGTASSSYSSRMTTLNNRKTTPRP